MITIIEVSEALEYLFPEAEAGKDYLLSQDLDESNNPIKEVEIIKWELPIEKPAISKLERVYNQISKVLEKPAYKDVSLVNDMSSRHYRMQSHFEKSNNVIDRIEAGENIGLMGVPIDKDGFPCDKKILKKRFSDEPPTSNKVSNTEFAIATQLPSKEMYNGISQRLMDTTILSLDLLWDRTNTLDLGITEFPYSKEFPLIDINNIDSSINPSFATIMDSTAANLWRRIESENKILTVFYSGGLDSVSLLIALLKTGTKNQIKKRLHIVLTEESIWEYPKFFNRYILETLNYFIIDSVYNYRPLDDELIVTGEYGDRLFGMGKGDYLRYGHADFPKDRVDPEVWEYLMPLLEKSPNGYKTVLDVMWWIRFALVYTLIGCRIAIGAGIPLSKYVLFFHSDEWQKWSILNHDKKIMDFGDTTKTWKSYKFPMKDYILDYTDDWQYYRNKTKYTSLRVNRNSYGTSSVYGITRKSLL